MMIIMHPNATKEEIQTVILCIDDQGLRSHMIEGTERTVIGAVGDSHDVSPDVFSILPGVESVMRISHPYKLASREFREQDSIFPLDGFSIGDREIAVIAGPCSVESREQLLEIAQAVREAGAHALRGGVYKPRTSPYVFQGLGEEGLEYLAEARQRTGMPVVAEIMSIAQVEVLSRYVDVLQVGARNMQNYALLRALGNVRLPVLLKRGMSATLDELLMSAEYILSGGNDRVILCERGIRTFETATRNTTDINAVPVLKSLTHLPVIVDPSHSTGYYEFVLPVARAAIAAGADGLIVEVHANPAKALSDGRQSLKPEKFAELVKQVEAVARAIGRSLAPIKKPERA